MCGSRSKIIAVNALKSTKQCENMFLPTESLYEKEHICNSEVKETMSLLPHFTGELFQHVQMVLYSSK
jgi:hypothetical protein